MKEIIGILIDLAEVIKKAAAAAFLFLLIRDAIHYGGFTLWLKEIF